jgi:hypothetical protein
LTVIIRWHVVVVRTEVADDLSNIFFSRLFQYFRIQIQNSRRRNRNLKLHGNRKFSSLQVCGIEIVFRTSSCQVEILIIEIEIFSHLPPPIGPQPMWIHIRSTPAAS